MGMLTLSPNHDGLLPAMTTLTGAWAGTGDDYAREERPSARVRPSTAATRARRLKRLRLIARVMDSCIELPGTKRRIGLDPLIGLVPVAGDIISTAVSLYIVWEGHRLGASRTQVVSMLGNVAIDLAGGAIPVIGDLFDFAFTANRRNLRILGIADEGFKVCIDADRGVQFR
jgi:hypothetical protein